MSYILIVNGKRKVFTSFEKIEATVRVYLSGDDKAQIERASAKGDALYITFNPFDSEMKAGEEDTTPSALIATSQEELDACFYTLREEI